MAKKNGKEKALLEEQVLVMRSGVRYPVTGEEGKWWLCGPVRFRKGNPAILRVETVEMHPVEDEPEEAEI